jgi:hypothetical protein
MAAHATATAAALPATWQSADAAPGVAGALPFQRRSPFGGVWNHGEAVLLISYQPKMFAYTRSETHAALVKLNIHSTCPCQPPPAAPRSCRQRFFHS